MATHPFAVQPQGPSSPSLAEFEALYAAEFGFVWRVLRRFGVPAWQLEDAVHDVFLVWVRRHREFARGATVRTCLYGIARRVAADARRTAYRAQRRHDALAAVLVDRDDSVERTLETQHALAVVDRALGELSDVQREVYLLAEVEGLSAQQIGAALSISPNTASSRLRLARQRLAAALGDARPPREEPPADSRTRVWAGLLPVWSSHSAPPPAAAAPAAAPYTLVTTLLVAALALLALAPPASPGPLDPPGARTPGASDMSSAPSPAPPVGHAAAPAPPDTPAAAAPAPPDTPAAAAPAPPDMPAAAPTAIAPVPADTPAAALDQPAPADMSAATFARRSAAPDSPPSPRPGRRAAVAPPRLPDAVRPAPASPVSEDILPEDPLAREAQQIAEAQRHLRSGRLDAALAALDAHAADAPHGRLADERETLRAAARCRRGDRDALADAERWFAGRPDAVALATARAYCRNDE